MTVKLTTLSNGLRIVTEDMPGLKSASAGVWVTAGGRHERPERVTRVKNDLAAIQTLIRERLRA